MIEFLEREPRDVRLIGDDRYGVVFDDRCNKWLPRARDRIDDE
jgi:hypothetical protein